MLIEYLIIMKLILLVVMYLYKREELYFENSVSNFVL